MKNLINNTLLFVCVSFVLVSCNTSNNIINQDLSSPPYLDSSQIHRVNSSVIAGIPFSDLEALRAYPDSTAYIIDGVLDYRYARDKAFAELSANLQNYYPDEILNDLGLPFDIRDHCLLSFTDRPVIVYDYEEKPYYYEFPLIYRGERIVGTVTVAAQPFNKELIHYLFPDNIQYSSYDYTYKRYVGEYPCVYYSDDNTIFYKADWNEYSEGILHTINSNILLKTDRHALIKEKMSRLSNLETNDIYSDIITENYLDDGDSYFHDINQFCDSFITDQSIINYWRNDISSYTSVCDTFAINSTILSWINENINAIDNSYQSFLQEYSNHRLRLIRWNGYCGPAIMAWLYRGKYKSYNDLYLPIFNDTLSFSSIYYDLIDNTACLQYFMKPYDSEYGDYPIIVELHSQRTDNGLFVDIFRYTNEICGEYPLLDWGLRNSLPTITGNDYYIRFVTAPISWIKNEQQPVVVEGIYGAPHYVGAIGYSYNQWLSLKYNMRLFVTDNGYFTAKYNNYPFWSILGGLNYAWVEND